MVVPQIWRIAKLKLTDVGQFCSHCSECLKFDRFVYTKVPLCPISIILEPFQRLALDIVGPLVKTSSFSIGFIASISLSKMFI